VALSASVLSAAIRVKLLTPPNAAQVQDTPGLTALCDAIAEACVEHILAAAVVTIPPGVPVATAGTAAAQTGATTAPAVGAIT
jgi:hypothetical protein